MAYKQVLAAATSNVNIAIAPPSFDGVSAPTLVNGSQVLLTRQTTTSQNGVWVWNGTGLPMTRPAGSDQYAGGTSLDNATIIWVTGGNTLAGTVWGLDPAARVTVDTTGHTLVPVHLPPVQARVATTANLNLSSPGVLIDPVVVNDGSMTTGGSSTTLTCSASRPFTSTDVGKSIVVDGAGPAGAGLVTTIAGYTDPAEVTLTTGCSTSVNGALVRFNVALNVGDIVLVMSQTTGSENGLYFWNGSSSAMTRCPEPLVPGRAVRVSEGTVHAHAHHLLVTQGAIKLGTTIPVFAPQNPTVNARDFGAKGDGVTDDTQALQAAINACLSAPRTKLFIPGGVYRTTESLFVMKTYAGVYAHVGIEIYGEKRTFGIPGQETIIKPDFNNNNNRPALVVQGARGVRIKDIGFEGQNNWSMALAQGPQALLDDSIFVVTPPAPPLPLPPYPPLSRQRQVPLRGDRGRPVCAQRGHAGSVSRS